MLVVAFSVHYQRQILAIGRMACHGGIDQGADVRPDLRPDVVETLAQCARMLGTEDGRVGVVVEKPERLSPRDEHGKLGLQKKADDGSEGMRPGFRDAERRL